MAYIIPHTFKAGEKAIAEQVNTNFNYVKQSLEQLNTTLSNKIDINQETINTQIENLQADTDDVAELITSRDEILKLGTIVTPDPTEDGQIPTADINLTADKIHTASILANSQIILPTLENSTNFANILFEFTLGSQCSLSLPLNIKWLSAEVPEPAADGVTINRLYFDTTTGGTNWCGFFSYHNTVEDQIFMNKKIFETLKYCSGCSKKVFATFVADQYGNWESHIDGYGNYASVGVNAMTSNYTYVYGGAHYWGYANASRTLDRIRLAKDISFTFESHRWGNTPAEWRGGWNAYVSFANDFIKICNSNSAYTVYVNNTALDVSLSENVTYNISIKQGHILIDGIKYPYPDGATLRNATSDYCSAYCYVGILFANGATTTGISYLNVSDLNVKWQKGKTMYAKLVDNKLKYAPYYLTTNSKLIINPQLQDYAKAGYKPVVYEPAPTLQAGQSVSESIVESENEIIVSYSIIENKNIETQPDIE